MYNMMTRMRLEWIDVEGAIDHREDTEDDDDDDEGINRALALQRGYLRRNQLVQLLSSPQYLFI
jgi:hypothetical protein